MALETNDNGNLSEKECWNTYDEIYRLVLKNPSDHQLYDFRTTLKDRAKKGDVAGDFYNRLVPRLNDFIQKKKDKNAFLIDVKEFAYEYYPR